MFEKRGDENRKLQSQIDIDKGLFTCLTLYWTHVIHVDMANKAHIERPSHIALIIQATDIYFRFTFFSLVENEY